MIYLLAINTGLLLAVLLQRQIKLSTLRRIEERQMAQETELQEIQAVLNTVSIGVTEIISRLNNLPTDNPAIQDEIDGIRAVGQRMADEIAAVLNPPTP